ncbi:hypothetical protein [Hydrocarboniphaga sp.]|nr:hypothetical protein [Hydrocarboniphaga sp.]
MSEYVGDIEQQQPQQSDAHRADNQCNPENDRQRGSNPEACTFPPDKPVS